MSVVATDGGPDSLSYFCVEEERARNSIRVGMI